MPLLSGNTWPTGIGAWKMNLEARGCESGWLTNGCPQSHHANCFAPYPASLPITSFLSHFLILWDSAEATWCRKTHWLDGVLWVKLVGWYMGWMKPNVVSMIFSRESKEARLIYSTLEPGEIWPFLLFIYLFKIFVNWGSKEGGPAGHSNYINIYGFSPT